MAHSSLVYGYEFSNKSPAQVSKDAQRWSLSQWMEQKGKLQWMDLWLNSNSQSPSFYEVYIGGDYSVMDITTQTFLSSPTVTPDISSRSAHVGLFVSVFGLYTRYEKSEDSEITSWDALAQLRLLGHSDQGSNLTLFFGLKDLNLALALDKSQHQQAGGSMTLYLLKQWGLQGRYARFLEDTASSGSTIEGYRVEATTWIEWGPLRIYGTWYKEPIERNTNGALTEVLFEGYSLGFRTYLDFKK